MSGPGDDDEPAPRRGAVPPPSPAPGDAPDSIDVPRMEPPPSSLEAMVQNRNRGPAPAEGASWLVWVVVLVVAAAIAGYVMK